MKIDVTFDEFLLIKHALRSYAAKTRRISFNELHNEAFLVSESAFDLLEKITKQCLDASNDNEVI